MRRACPGETPLLAYETRREVSSHSHVLLFYHSGEEEETISTRYVEVHDGIVSRFWQDG